LNASRGSKVTVAAAEHTEEVDREQTVSSGNERARLRHGARGARSRGSREIEGLAGGVQVVNI